MSKKLQFSSNEYVVYPAHGVGKVVSIEEQEITGVSLELYVVVFEKDKLEDNTVDIRHLPAGVYNCSYYSEKIYHSEKLLLIK